MRNAQRERRTVAGGDTVDADLRSPLGSEALGQIDDRRLGRVVKDLLQQRHRSACRAKLDGGSPE